MAMEEERDQKSINVDISALLTALQIGNRNSAGIVDQLDRRFASQTADNTRIAIANSTAGGTLVSSSPCYLVSISVVVASTGLTGLCYDSASVLNAGSTNAFAVIPSSGFMTVNWPCLNGLVVQPSTSGTQTVAVSYI
jgi:hypothetical protein